MFIFSIYCEIKIFTGGFSGSFHDLGLHSSDELHNSDAEKCPEAKKRMWAFKFVGLLIGPTV